MIISGYVNKDWKIRYDDFGMIILPVLFEAKRKNAELLITITIKEGGKVKKAKKVVKKKK